MSTIYSAGQYDDAFVPKRLGNWESTAKESFPFRKSSTRQNQVPKIIVNSRGHLLPWIPRGDKSSSWGLLNLHLRNKYSNNRTTSMVVMSGPGKQQSLSASKIFPTSGVLKRLKKLPKYAPRQVENSPPADLLLEYLRHLKLPLVWIIGPATRNTFQKRKQFAKQLASTLSYGYVNLEEKIQEWKERQQICTCSGSSTTTSLPSLMDYSGGGNSNAVVTPNPGPGPLHSLEGTSIAPSKLPTNVPPFISPNIPAPPETPGVSGGDVNQYLLNILESQRITFDTALPIERQKILELYKFAMAECLPCQGFIFDSVPFDLVEGLQFERVFYPAALAIYFTEGVPQSKKKHKLKDRRITACTTGITSLPSTSISQSSKKETMSAQDCFLERDSSRRLGQNVYLKTKSHRRLGVFNLIEGEKICKQFGSKTIRIINAEDVESDTMDFLNELVKKNLDRHEDAMRDHTKSNTGLGGKVEIISTCAIPSATIDRPVASRVRTSPSTAYSSTFILEEEEQALAEREELEEITVKYHLDEEEITNDAVRRQPPPLVTANHSNTSLFTLPKFFDSASTSTAVSPRTSLHLMSSEEKLVSYVPLPIIETDNGGAGDYVDSHNPAEDRKKSAEIWEKISKLESKVAHTPDVCSATSTMHNNIYDERDQDTDEGYRITVEVDVDNGSLPLPPPTAYADSDDEDHVHHQFLDKEDEEKYTAAIRNAIRPPNYHGPMVLLPNEYQQDLSSSPLPSRTHLPLPESNYDYRASGDFNVVGEPFESPSERTQHYLHHPQLQQKRKSTLSLPSKAEESNDKPGTLINNYTSDTYQEDPFYDS